MGFLKRLEGLPRGIKSSKSAGALPRDVRRLGLGMALYGADRGGFR